jgi:hypothetical protein
MTGEVDHLEALSRMAGSRRGQSHDAAALPAQARQPMHRLPGELDRDP